MLNFICKFLSLRLQSQGMGIMSRKNVFLMATISFYWSIANAEFPVTRNLGSLPVLDIPRQLGEVRLVPAPGDSLQGRHSALAHDVAYPPSGNCFSCCFVFRLSSGEEVEIPLFRDLVLRNHPRRKFVNADKLAVLAEPSEANIIFKSHDGDTDVYSKIKFLYEHFIDKVRQNSTTENSATKNQAMLLIALKDRAKDERGEWRMDVLRAMRSTDSEAGALYVLQHRYVIDNIINQLCSQIPVGAQISSIEFHGCTTRDMCALCFTNMNIIQYLCNDTSAYNPMEFSFLRYLKHVLTQPISAEFQREHTNAEVARTYATPECSVKMFISSTRVDNDNLNFQTPALTEGEGENFLYQFRMQPPPPVRRPLRNTRPNGSSN